MVFSKNFPRTEKNSTYPVWEEIELSSSEEKDIDGLARSENIALMKQCIEDARLIIDSQNMRDYQTDFVRIAISLFEKRSSHVVYWKEQACKEKFDVKFKEE